jgi:hypothetical protein
LTLATTVEVSALKLLEIPFAWDPGHLMRGQFSLNEEEPSQGLWRRSRRGVLGSPTSTMTTSKSEVCFVHAVHVAGDRVTAGRYSSSWG